ncbi:MAG: rhomboid family intramembrane serine protease [Chitinophagaceae bacterium]|nr:rhomboid family intramembrane serine protease [Chitinophagaceae bacterium]MCW5926166.1 rhomboid family intramembrane serine protease [Chitinophagaceae bacterium]
MGVLEQARGKKIFLGSDNDALIKVIVINILITAMLFLVKGIYQISNIDISSYQGQVLQHFLLPASFAGAIRSPWTFLTYMFVHIGIWSLIANMLWLWAFGVIMQTLYGGRRLVPLYIYGGLAGALSFLVAGLALSGGAAASLAGASPSVMAVAVAITVAAPGYRIFPMLAGGIRLWILTLVYVVINVVGSSYSPAMYAAQLGGAAMGFVYMTVLHRGTDIGTWMNRLYDWFFNLFNPDIRSPRKQKDRETVFYDTAGKKPFKRKPNLNQQRVDEILDKINNSGMQSLSQEEKDLLRRASEEDL